MKYRKNPHSPKIRKWLRSGGNAKITRIKAWLQNQGHPEDAIVHLLHGEKFTKERKRVVAEFRLR